MHRSDVGLLQTADREYWLDELNVLCGFTEFMRRNFGLYQPACDYKALRQENLARARNGSPFAPGTFGRK